MKRGPELLLKIAPFAIFGGIALAKAQSQPGDTTAWCIATGCGVVCVIGAIAGIRFARFSISSHARETTDEYFRNRPAEFDVLFSDESEDRKVAAITALADLGLNPNSPFRKDIIENLKFVIDSPRSNSRVVDHASLELSRLTHKQPGAYSSNRFQQILAEIDNRIKVLTQESSSQTTQLEFAIKRAELNRQKLRNHESLAAEMVRRSLGRDWIDITTVEELDLVSGEPWVLLLPEAIRVTREAISLDWRLYEAQRKFRSQTRDPLVGYLGRAMSATNPHGGARVAA
jgi:hypothetical protein